MSRENLSLETVIDKNGNQTRRWKRTDSDKEGSNAKKLEAVKPKSDVKAGQGEGGSSHDKGELQNDLLGDGETRFEFERKDGIKEVYSIEPVSDMSADTPVYAGIINSNGDEIAAMDYGSETTHKLADGSTRRSWVHPEIIRDGDFYEGETDASETLSREEFDALEEANDFAESFMDGNRGVPEYSKENEGEATEYIADRMIDRASNK